MQTRQSGRVPRWTVSRRVKNASPQVSFSSSLWDHLDMETCALAKASPVWPLIYERAGGI